MTSSREQIEADAALARRLQEEEFGSPVFFRTAPQSPHTPPNSAPPRTIPGAPRQTHGGYDRMGPRQPTPPLPPHQTHPYAQGHPNYSQGDMLSEFFRRAGEPFPAGVPDALDSLREFGDFPGRGYVLREDDRRRQASSRNRNPAPPSPEMLMESFFGAPFGHGPGGIQAGGGGSGSRSGSRSGSSFVMTPQGVTRIDFSSQSTRNRDRSRDDRHPQRRHSNRGSPRASRQSQESSRPHPRGVPRYPQPQRYPQPDEVNQHHIFQRGDGDTEAFRDIGEMLNEVFSDMFTAFNRDRMPARAGAAGFPGAMGGNLMEYLQSVLPGAGGMGMNGEPQQYEDWLQFIDRMGHVNRGASETEISRLPSEKFDRKLLERVRMKRRQREGSNASGSGSAGGSSAAGASSSKTGTDEGEKCAICLGEYEEGEEVKTLPCFHVFHTECVDRWLKVNKICPFCKQSIRPGDGAGA